MRRSEVKKHAVAVDLYEILDRATMWRNFASRHADEAVAERPPSARNRGGSTNVYGNAEGRCDAALLGVGVAVDDGDVQRKADLGVAE
jgi:hypothetical protein